jgi:hypothetical protein
MSLRKKYVNSTLINKTCAKCGNTYPRTEEFFYRKKHHSSKNAFVYVSYCITCELERTNKYKKNNKKRRAEKQLEYSQTERGYFISLFNGIKKSKKINLFRDFDEFIGCWHKQQEEYGKYCPYYPHIEMTRIRGKGKPTETNISVDRLVNTLPYDKNNIMFISWKANNEKGNVSPYLAEKMLKFIENKKILKIFVDIDTGNRTNKPFIPAYKR